MATGDEALGVRRASYYGTVLLAHILIHQGLVNDLLGSSLTDLLRRNNEGYILMLLLPAYWDLFAKPTDPDGRGRTMTIGPSWKGQGAWFAAVIGALLVLSFEDLGKDTLGLPQSIITLREAFIAILVLCVYLGWSRRIFPGPLHVIDGAPVATVRQRSIAYSVTITIVVAIWLDAARPLLGDLVGDGLELQTEALAAIVLIALYFDLVAPSTRAWIRTVWYAALVITPVAVQGGFIDETLPPRIATWLGQATESFLAAFFIAVYFDVWRRPYGISRLKGDDRPATLLAR